MKEVRQVNDSLYELYKPKGTPTVQILFFHGLRSGDLSNAHISTWKSEDDSCIWPQEWLPEIFPRAHIYTVRYGEVARIFDMFRLGENLISDLTEGDIGQITSCPVILVGHSVGGLVIKETCCQAHDRLHSNIALSKYKEKLGKFLRNIRGIFYYSTPHHGSSIIAKATDGPLFQFFKILNEHVERLNWKFEDLQSIYKWLIFGLGESLPSTSTWQSLLNYSNPVVVPEASSRQGNYLTVAADHNSICQPTSKVDKRFYHLTNLIETVFIELQGRGEVHEETELEGAYHQNSQQESETSLTIPTTILNIEGSYVPIQRSHSSVVAAIEKPRGAHVILLYGGVGKGKSTLARYMYERYGKDGHCLELFEHVIWLSCANCSVKDTVTKQFEILQDQAPNNFGNFLPEEKSFPKGRITKAFQDFLGHKKILIILDDVSDPRFLYEMWKVVMGTGHVKYLVTSQKANICSSLGKDSVRIAMEDPTEEEAKSILACHVGLQAEVIPDYLQEVAEKMIHITEGNPLALACLASHFAYSEDKENEEVWQEAYGDLRDLLDSPEEKILLGDTVSAPRSLCAAMKICIDSLENVDSKKLLSLMFAFKGELVLEIVLRAWHSGMKKSRSPFKRSIEELLMRELVKRFLGTTASYITSLHEKDAKDEAQLVITLWSIRSLVKLYLEQTMAKREISSLFCELIGNEEHSLDSSELEVTELEKRRVTIALCALYINPEHIEKTVMDAITKASIAFDIASMLGNIDDLRRKAVEPIIWLLRKADKKGQWTPADVHCVRKVLLTYICKVELDDENISHLLKLDACTGAQLVTLNFITQICIIEDKALFNENNRNFLQAILHLLRLNEGLPLPTEVQVQASRTLCDICWKAGQDNSQLLVVDTPGVLDFLVCSLANNQCPDMLRGNAALALANLAFRDDSIKLRIANQEGTLASLVKLLSPHENPIVQEEAAKALANLASSGDNSLQVRIATEEGAILGLVKCLVQDHPGLLREVAAAALGNLAKTELIRWIIAEEEGALTGLVTLLFTEENPTVLSSAADAMRRLCQTKDDCLRFRIAKQEGVIASLVTCMMHDDPEVQEPAITALFLLARTDPMKWSLANEEGFLNCLVKLLFAEDKPKVQTAAAFAMVALSTTENYLLKLLIAKEEGVLAGLQKLISMRDHPKLQEYATGALGNMASTEPIVTRVANGDGGVDGVVKLLFVQDNSLLQGFAASALQNLAANDSLKLLIANEHGAPAGLLTCLAVRDHPSVQRHAAWALLYLAQSEQARAILNKGMEGLIRKGWSSLLADGVPIEIQYSGVSALTLINPSISQEASLVSAAAYQGRADAFVSMGMYMEALSDFDLAVGLQHRADSQSLSRRCFVKAKLGEYEGALDDANEAVKVSNSNSRAFTLQERGVLKRMMGDLEGALADLDEGLKLETAGYELLKHRGHVKFLLKDEDGARTDAEWALRVKPPTVDRQGYGTTAILGKSPAEYMGYQLR
ncbi:unnamed protein product [Calypogeia fissa]